MHTSKYYIALLAIIVGPSAVFSADRIEIRGVDQEQAASVKDFLHTNPDCREFNDQCSLCAVSDGKAECSTPQIACVKQRYQCTARSNN
nr:hypothetical protein [Ensifer sp. WSM1721]